MSKTKYKAIEIVSFDTGEVTHTAKLDPPKGERMAERKSRGININLSPRLYTRLVEA